MSHLYDTMIRMKKVLTISIAAYNVKNTLRECLDHLVSASKIDDLEILVVDDGSKDETPKITQEYVKKYPRSVRLVSKENGGWGSTVNKGIEIATGKYFKQLDGDDYYDTGNLDRFVDFLWNSDTDLVSSPFCHFEDETGAITGVFSEVNQYVGYDAINIDEIPDIYLPAMHQLTVKTSVLQSAKVRLLKHCFYTDVEFDIKAFNNANTISFFGLPIYYYRLGRDGQSMSIAGVRKHYKDHERILLSMIKYMNAESQSKIKKDIIRQRLADVTMYQYKFYLALENTKQHKQELKEFDNSLRRLSKDIYNGNYGLPIRLLRRYNFNGYSLVSIIKNHQDKKNEVFLYEK